MNPDLHHKWNAGRDGSRGNSEPKEQAPPDVQVNKVLLKRSQNTRP